MMKIIDTEHCKSVSIEMDEYIPFSIEFEGGYQSPLLYWRGGDGKFSLVEVALSKKTGVIRSVTLTAIASDKVIKVNKSVMEGKKPEVEGIPIFDLSGWLEPDTGEFSDSFLDEMPSDICLLVGSDFISLTFGSEVMTTPTRLITSGNVLFGVNLDGELSNIEIRNLSKEQMLLIASL